MKLLSTKLRARLTKCLLGLTLLFACSCSQVKEPNLDEICGNWVSTTTKPNVTIFKEGDLYKLTLFRKSGMTRQVKPETFLIVRENGNFFINTGFRIDIAYNKKRDVLTFSPNGDYTRASKSNNHKKEVK